MRRPTWISALLAGVVAMSLAACSASQPPKDPAPAPNQPAPAAFGGTLVQTTFSDAKVLNPILTNDVPSSNITGYIFQGMIRLDKSAGVVPNLAKKWDISDDQKSVTFELWPNVKFHDGVLMTTKDVAFTFKAALHPGYTGPRQSYFTPLKGGTDYKKALAALRADLKDKKIDQAAFDAKSLEAYNTMLAAGGIKIIDDTHIQFVLDEPYAPFLTVTAGFGILPEHLLKDELGLKMADSAFNQKPVGTGPYKFVEWAKNDHITLQRNPDLAWGFFPQASKIEKIIVKVVPDANAVEASVENGEAQYGAIQSQNFDHFKNDVKSVQTYDYGQFSYTFVGWNEVNPLFKEAKVRQALTMAIDRKAIVDQIVMGHGSLANTHGSPFRWDYDANVQVFDFNPDKALAQLKEAGWTKGADGTLTKDGKPFAFKLITNKGNKAREDICVVIQQQLGKLGIKVDVDYMEFQAMLGVINAGKAEAFVLGWSLGAEPDSTDIFGSDGGFKSMISYKNARIDELEKQGRTTLDTTKRKVIYAEIQRLLAQDQPYTWLYYPNSLEALSKKVQGPIDPSPTGLLWNHPQLSITQ